jgi:hypothetical protein
MAVALLLDVHVDHAILAQLRLREVDVLTAQDEGVQRVPDDLLLKHASQLGRPPFHARHSISSDGRRLAAAGTTFLWTDLWPSHAIVDRTMREGFRNIGQSNGPGGLGEHDR